MSNVRAQIPHAAAPAGRRGRCVCCIVRRTIMLGALAATLLLFYWSRVGDPRFYAFLETDTGKTLASVFGWYDSYLERPPSEKPEWRMTPDERNVRRNILRLLHAYGYDQAFTVGFRDVAFCLEMEHMTVHVAPPYLVITDSPAAGVPSRIEVLAKAHEVFQKNFASLTRSKGPNQLSHVLLFSKPEDYLAYQQRYAPVMENTSGFYSPVVDRLVLFEDAGHPAHRGEDDGQTLPTLRHEGAHQFLFAHGVHSRHRIENDWLVEGLATYFEAAEAGAADAGRVTMLTNALRTGSIIPLNDLVGQRQTEGLLAYKPAELAYSEAWALVHYLMRDEARAVFFDYIRFVRDPRNFKKVRSISRIELLCSFLDISPAELQTQWEDYLVELASETV